MWTWLRWVLLGLLLLLLLPIGLLILAMLVTPKMDLANPKPTLETIRRRYGLPAVGMALITDQGVQVCVSGVRKQGDTTPVTDQDLWHLGSCGKAITATMIARLVERGTLRWDQSLGETFGDLSDQMSSQFQSITLEQLLSHRSGLDANFDLVKYVERRDLQAARRDVLLDALAQPLQYSPGTQFLYSNWGYTLAAAMAERATGKSFEELVSEELFQPLGITSAGFGGTGTPGKIDQPWPHAADGTPMESNGPEMDNVPTMAPAGTMHMTLADWSKFIREHLRGPRGQSPLLSQQSFEKLHKIQIEDYALGWMVVERAWGKGAVITHSGDNTMNHAVVWAAPNTGKAVLVVTNQSEAADALDQIATAAVLSQ